MHGEKEESVHLHVHLCVKERVREGRKKEEWEEERKWEENPSIKSHYQLFSALKAAGLKHMFEHAGTTAPWWLLSNCAEEIKLI